MDILTQIRAQPASRVYGHIPSRTQSLTDWSKKHQFDQKEQGVIEEVCKGTRNEALLHDDERYFLLVHAPQGNRDPETGRSIGYIVRELEAGGPNRDGTAWGSLLSVIVVCGLVAMLWTIYDMRAIVSKAVDAQVGTTSADAHLAELESRLASAETRLRGDGSSRSQEASSSKIVEAQLVMNRAVTQLDGKMDQLLESAHTPNRAFGSTQLSVLTTTPESEWDTHVTGHIWYLGEKLNDQVKIFMITGKKSSLQELSLETGFEDIGLHRSRHLDGEGYIYVPEMEFENGPYIFFLMRNMPML